MKAKMKHAKDEVLIKCGHCGIEQAVDKNALTEPIDAFGDFIDIYYKDTEYERLTHREEKLREKGQYTELTLVYSFLADIAQINKKKFLEEYEATKDPADLETAEQWDQVGRDYKTNETV